MKPRDVGRSDGSTDLSEDRRSMWRTTMPEKRVRSISVVLCLHDGVVRERLASLFHRNQGIELLGSFDNVHDTVDACMELRPDVTIVDISTVSSHNHLLGNALLDERYSRCVVYLNAARDARTAGGMVSLARGRTFVDMIRCISADLDVGDHAPSTVAGLTNDQRRDDVSGLSRLTNREMQVLRRLAVGQSVRQCAESLRLSPSTVDNHKVRLMKKLGVHKSVELVHAAIRMGVVTP